MQKKDQNTNILALFDGDTADTSDGFHSELQHSFATLLLTSALL